MIKNGTIIIKKNPHFEINTFKILPKVGYLVLSFNLPTKNSDEKLLLATVNVVSFSLITSLFIMNNMLIVI